MPIIEHSFRAMLLQQADRIGLLEEVQRLSDIQAVRRLQSHGGYTDCFGRDVALRPNADGTCGEYNCWWRELCDSYRGGVLPVDKALYAFNQDKLENLRHSIAELKQTSLESVTSGSSLGMKVSSLGKLAGLTKKLIIGSEETLITEASDREERLNAYLLSHSTFHNYPTPGGLHPEYDVRRTLLYSHGLNELTEWLQAASGFIKDGTVRYRPLVSEVSDRVMVRSHLVHGVDTFGFPKPSFPTFPDFDAPHRGVLNEDVYLTEPDVAPILNLHLPVLENSSLETLHRLAAEHPEELRSFRRYLQSAVESMRLDVAGSEAALHGIRKVERGIQDELGKLRSDLKKHSIKSLLDHSGMAIAGWTLALFCIVSSHSDVLGVLGANGVLYKLSQAYSEYLRSRITLKESPVYFLWLIGEETERSFMV